MASWNQLSDELRQEVIQRMDFIQRFRFRAVSKTDKKLVDSTPLYIPRVCFKSVKDESSVLTFYLGIEKRIDVIFEKSGDRVKLQRLTNLQYKTILGSYAFRNIFSIPFQLFADIVMNPNTILGGFEFLPDVLTFDHSCYIMSIFQNRPLIRTKILTIENGCWAFILTYCSIPDLLELQVMGTSEKGDSWLQLACQTRRDEYRMVGVSDKKIKKYAETGTGIYQRDYLITGEENVEKLAKSKKEFQKFLKDLHVEKVAPNYYKYYTHFPNGCMKTVMTSCGVTMEFMQEKMERQNPTSCGMRWACAKHADPFEHWYYTNLHETVIFVMPESIPIKLSGKLRYSEVVYPIINGKCTMDDIVQGIHGIFAKFPGSTIRFPIFGVRDGMIGEKLNGTPVLIRDTLKMGRDELEKVVREKSEEDPEKVINDRLEALQLGN